MEIVRRAGVSKLVELWSAQDPLLNRDLGGLVLLNRRSVLHFVQPCLHLLGFSHRLLWALLLRHRLLLTRDRQSRFLDLVLWLARTTAGILTHFKS